MGFGAVHNVKRISASYTLQDGLEVSIQTNSAVFENVFENGPKMLFKRCALLCRNVEPRINPWRPFVNPYNFILSKRRSRPRPR